MIGRGLSSLNRFLNTSESDEQCDVIRLTEEFHCKGRQVHDHLSKKHLFSVYAIVQCPHKLSSIHVETVYFVVDLMGYEIRFETTLFKMAFSLR
jgi:hypothetical protein